WIPGWVQDNYFIMILSTQFNENNKNIIFLRKYYSHCNGELEPFHKSVPVAKDHNNSDSSNAALLEILPVNSTEPITHEKVFTRMTRMACSCMDHFLIAMENWSHFADPYDSRPLNSSYRNYATALEMLLINSSNRITAETNLGYNSLEILKILLFGSIDITSSIIYRYDIDDVTRFHKILPRSYQISPDFARILYISSDLTKLHQNTPYIFRFLRNSPFFSKF
ncbi:hypothetical protein V1477_014473, partial [Vespula maculifrons]